MRQLWQPIPNLVRGQCLDRRQRPPPAAGIGIVPVAELGAELQQPRQSVGPFETGAAGRLQVRRFALQIGDGQAPGQRRPRRLCRLRVRVAPRQPGQQPVPVHRRVPVVAPVERRGQLAGWARVFVAVEHMRDLVGVLAVHAVEGKAGEACGERRIRLRSRSRRGAADKHQEKQNGDDMSVLGHGTAPREVRSPRTRGCKCTAWETQHGKPPHVTGV